MNKLAKAEISWSRINQTAQTHKGRGMGDWSSQLLNIFSWGLNIL